MDNKDDIIGKIVKSAETFTLTPSAKVWSNVEKDILQRSRKKRITGFIFISIPVLFLSAIYLYFLLSVHTQDSHAFKTENSMTNRNSPVNHEHATAAKINKESGENDTSDDVNTPQNKTHSISLIVPDLPLPQNKASQTSDASDQFAFSRKTSNDIAATDKELKSPPSIKQEGNISNKASQKLPEKVIINKPDTVTKDFVNDSLQKDSLVIDLRSNKSEKVFRNTPTHKWGIGIGIAGAKSFTNIQEEGDYQFIKRYRDSTDKNLLAMNYGLTFSYDIIPNVTIYAGLGLTTYKQKILSRQMVYGFDTSLFMSPLPIQIITIKKDFYDINGDSIGNVRNSFTYLSIPLGVRYNFFPGKKFGFSIQAELSVNKLISSKGYVYNKDDFRYTDQIKANLKPWMISYSFGLPVQYKAFRNFTIELIPVYSIYHGSVYRSSYSVSQKLQQIELFLNFRYAFH